MPTKKYGEQDFYERKLNRVMARLEIPAEKFDWSISRSAAYVEFHYNYMPACPKCNHYKHTLTFDDFREQIGLLTGRLRERVYIYKLALRHGRISESSEPVIFYFEQLTKDKNGATQ